MARRKPDVIIILGGGIGKNLEPVLYTKERLEEFIKRAKDFAEVPIIVSGRYGEWKNPKPKYTEADAMKHYLVKHGIPSRLIHVDGRSGDTIGNACYVKRIVKNHKSWRRFLVVTTAGHVPRSRWIFKKVFGRGFEIQFWGISSTSQYFIENLAGRREYERYLVEVYKSVFKACRDGDDLCVMRAARKIYPIIQKPTPLKNPSVKS